MPPHDWIESTLGHGTLMCKHCHMTDREATVLGQLNECPAAPPPAAHEADEPTAHEAEGAMRYVMRVKKPRAGWSTLAPDWKALAIQAATALEPLASRFLYPDDIDSQYAAGLRADPDWNESANEATLDDVWVTRRDIRAAREASAAIKGAENG